MNLVLTCPTAAPHYPGLVAILYDWQALAGGVLALLAAIFAALPVWLQVKSLRLQSGIMARDTLLKRSVYLEKRRYETISELGRIRDTFRGWRDYDEPTQINSESAFAAEAVARELVTSLTEMQEASLDGAVVDERRSVLRNHGRALEKCLRSIHAPYSIARDEITSEELLELINRSNLAEKKLARIISDLEESVSALDSAFLEATDRIRTRIREIDGR